MWNFYKMMFLFMILMSTLIVISANSWFTMWVGLEINMLSIIPLMNNMKNSYSTEATLKYFIIQAMASSIFLMSIFMVSFNFYTQLTSNLFSMILSTSLLLKLGMSPFHFWFPEVLEGLNWINCMIMLIWQKISPMIMLMYNEHSNELFIIAICSSMIISGVMGMNQISLRKILAYSSINHMAWMLAALLISSSIWLIYFLIYFIMSFLLMLYFLKFNFFYITQISLNNKMMSLFIAINLLSMMGLPPFLGFLSKWLVIQLLLQYHMLILATLMVIFTLISMYFYIRLVILNMLIDLSKPNFIYINQKNNFLYWISLTFILMSLITCSVLFNLN